MAKQDRSYGFVGVNMPRSIALRMALIQQMIDPEDIYEDKGGFGLERHPHVTVAYGHDQEDPQTAREAIQDIIDGEGTVGGLSTFDNPDYKVLKFDVDSPTLYELNKAIRDKVGLPGSTFKDYKPHMTVAYLKKDADPEKYRKLEKVISGMRFPVKMLDFRTPSDKRTTILMNRALQKQADDKGPVPEKLPSHKGTLTPTGKMTDAWNKIVDDKRTLVDAPKAAGNTEAAIKGMDKLTPRVNRLLGMAFHQKELTDQATGTTTPRKAIMAQYPTEEAFNKRLAQARAFRAANPDDDNMQLSDEALDRRVRYKFHNTPESRGRDATYSYTRNEVDVYPEVDSPEDSPGVPYGVVPHEYRHALQSYWSKSPKNQPVYNAAVLKYNDKAKKAPLTYLLKDQGEREVRLGGLNALAAHLGTDVSTPEKAYKFLDSYAKGDLTGFDRHLPLPAIAGHDSQYLKELRKKMLEEGDEKGWKELLEALSKDMPRFVKADSSGPPENKEDPMNRALRKQAAEDITYEERKGTTRNRFKDGKAVPVSTLTILALLKGKQVGKGQILLDHGGKTVFRKLEVDKDHRGKGIASELMRRKLKYADDNDLKEVYLRANPYNDEPLTREELMAFYAKHGFEPTGEEGDELPGGGWPVGKGPGAMIRKKAQNSGPPENKEDPMNNERLRKLAKIILDIELGDEVLVGRFKNKKVKVETISTDENGQPTINGRKLLALRIAKLMPEDGPKAATTSAAAKGMKKNACEGPRWEELRKNAELNKQANIFTTLVKGLQERVQSDYKKRERDYGASVAPDKYHGLSMPENFKTDLKDNIDRIREIVNGMGSPKTWWYSMHPDTLYGMDLTPVSDIHDYEYTYPNTQFKTEEEAMAYRDAADERFKENIMRLIDRHSTKVTKAQGIDEKRRQMAEDYLKMLRLAGPKTFLKIHPIGGQAAEAPLQKAAQLPS